MGNIGGMAFKNGIVFHGENYTVTTKTLDDGSVAVEYDKLELQERKSNFNLDIPFIRGYIILFTIILVGLKNSWKTTLSIVIALNLLSLFLFKGTSGDVNISDSNSLMIIGLLLLNAIYMKITQTAKFHAAEHMGIATIEKGLTITSENICKQSRIHKNCGTNLVIFIFLIILILESLGLNILISVLISYSVAYELFRLKEGKIYKLLTPVYLVGFFVQKYLYTSKPDEIHIKTAEIGLNKLKELENWD